MFSKDIKSLLLHLSCVIILFFVFYFPNKISEMNKSKKQLITFLADKQMNEDFYYFNIEINNKMTGVKVPNVNFIGEENDKSVQKLFDLMINKPLLIYRFGEIKCNSCFETEIKELQREFDDNPSLVCILCSYWSNLEFHNFKRFNRINFPLYRIDKDAFEWEIENNGNPYYFILHQNMKISHIYVPNKAYPELSKQYLEGVKRFLSDKDKKLEN